VNKKLVFISIQGNIVLEKTVHSARKNCS